MRHHFLVIDDDPDFAQMITEILGEEGFSAHTEGSGLGGLDALEEGEFSLVLLDLELPDVSGLEVLRRMRSSGREEAVVMITGQGSVASAVSALKLGAIDYFEKPVKKSELIDAIEIVLSPEREDRKSLARREIVGECSEINSVWQSIDTFGPTDLPILLQGETGTGKELFARAIHDLSKRLDGPFVPINCAALSESLIESELFGYEKGAFTGAYRDKPGMMEWAHGGTLFLDEIGEMPPNAQAKLLRAIETRTITPVGAGNAKPVQLNLRFVSSTNRDLKTAMERQEFREDLFYRLAGVTIELPPLRARLTDLDHLVAHFLDANEKLLDRTGLSISPEALDLLRSHDWPGNIRELKHVLGVAAVRAGDVILPGHLSISVEDAPPHPIGQPGQFVKEGIIRTDIPFELDGPIDLKRLKAEVAHQAELQVISLARETHQGTLADLAESLNIDPKTLRAKLKEIDN